MTDYTQLITSEHIDKPNFVAMVGLVSGAFDGITQLLQSMPEAFDLDNAVGPQLDVVGAWVGRPRLVDEVLTAGFFGFADDGAALTFGELSDPSVGGRFYELGESFATTTTLGDPEYLTIIKAKIVRNQWDGTTPGLEAALTYIFGPGCYVTDNGTLNLTITIGRPITAVEKALLSTFDLLPRPTGVLIGTLRYVTPIAGNAVSATSATGSLP